MIKFVYVVVKNMASSVVSDFIDCPSLSTLEQCTRDQLLVIAAHYQIEVSDRKLKKTIKATEKPGLQEQGVLRSLPANLSFEQQNSAGALLGLVVSSQLGAGGGLSAVFPKSALHGRASRTMSPSLNT